MTNLSVVYADRMDHERAFVDLLASTRIPPPVGIPKPLLQNEQECLNRLQRLHVARASAAKMDLVGLSVELDEIYTEIETIAPEYTYLKRGKPLNFEEARECLESR